MVYAHAGAGAAGMPLAAQGLGLVTAAALGWCYYTGARRIARARPDRAAAGRQLVLLVGIAVTVVVLAPPVAEWSEGRLATHMAQHMVLMLVAAPALAYGASALPLLAVAPRRVRAPLVRLARRAPTAAATSPIFAWSLHIGLLWLWHLPIAFDAAESSTPVHGLEHVSFLFPAWLFWWHLATRSRHRLRGPTAVLYLVAAMPPGAALGALLTFARSPLYPAQAAEAVSRGIDPLKDQILAGLVMWVPMEFAYLVVAAVIFSMWFRGLGRVGSTVRGRPQLAANATGKGSS